MEGTRDNYTVIPGWTKRLGLSLVEKVVYCVIYGFSQDEDSTFHGSRAYLASICECSTKTVDRTIAALLEKKLIRKQEKTVGGVKFCRYSANVPGRDIVSPVGTFCPEGRDILSHNDENTDVFSNSNNKDVNARARESQKFDFVEALVSMGVERSTAADWTATRKKAGASNNQSEYDLIAAQIQRACDRYGYTAQECVAYAAGRTWRGFNADWEDVKKIKNGNNSRDNAEGDKWLF